MKKEDYTFNDYFTDLDWLKGYNISESNAREFIQNMLKRKPCKECLKAILEEEN